MRCLLFVLMSGGLACARPATNPCPGWSEGGGTCESVADCSYAGDCNHGACVCDAPYTGSNCTGLAIGASRVLLGGHGASFWDGSIVRGQDGRYALFASEFANACGLATWAQNSECVRAMGDAPLGPYGPPEVVVPALCHNASARRAPDGSVLLYSIGEPADGGGEVTACDGGVTMGSVASGLNASTCVIEVARAPDVTGPFALLTPLTSAVLGSQLCPTNPAPVLDADGGVDLFYRAYASVDLSTSLTQEKLYVTHTPRWDAPATEPGTLLFDALAEDPFVWIDARRHIWHVLYNEKFTDPVAVGGHAVSPDGVHWTVLPPVYTLEVPFEDGTIHEVARRERPQVYWEDACHGVLLTAAQPGDGTDSSEVLAAPIGPLDAGSP